MVIGNPPYARKQNLIANYPELCDFYEENYVAATANYDIYALFMERSLDLISDVGEISYILPHKFLISDFGIGTRKLFKAKTALDKLIHFGSEMVFADASTYTCILNLNNRRKEKLYFKRIKPTELDSVPKWQEISYSELDDSNWDLQNQNVNGIIKRLHQQPYSIEDIFKRIYVGIQTSLDTFFVVEKLPNGNFYSKMLEHEIELEMGALKPFVRGNQLSKYQPIKSSLFTLFPYQVVGNRAVPYAFVEIEKQFPKAAQYFRQCESFLRQREKGRFDNENEWFLFSRKQGIDDVEYPKILTQEISLGCTMTFDDNGAFYHPTTVYAFQKDPKFNVDDKFYLGILNSKVLWFFIKNTGTELRGGYFRFKTNYLKPFPLPEIPNDPTLMITLVEEILNKNKTLQLLVESLLSLLQSKFSIEKPSKKLQNWPDLDFKGFLGELKKAKVSLSLDEEEEWMNYFTKKKQEANTLQQEITRLDNEIDQMVYKLYGLTDDEIKIVEESVG